MIFEYYDLYVDKKNICSNKSIKLQLGYYSVVICISQLNDQNKFKAKFKLYEEK